MKETTEKIVISIVGLLAVFYLLISAIYYIAYKRNYYSPCESKPLVRTVMSIIVALGLCSTLIALLLHANVGLIMLMILGFYYITYCLGALISYCEIQPRYKFYHTVQKVDWYLSIVVSVTIVITIMAVALFGALTPA